jgi:hypothetical protein
MIPGVLPPNLDDIFVKDSCGAKEEEETDLARGCRPIGGESIVLRQNKFANTNTSLLRHGVQVAV